MSPGVVFGSREWANELLRSTIREIKNSDRSRSGRFVETLAIIHLLLDQGYWWQATRLKNWLYRCWSDLQPRRADPRERRGGSF